MHGTYFPPILTLARLGRGGFGASRMEETALVELFENEGKKTREGKEERHEFVAESSFQTWVI